MLVAWERVRDYSDIIFEKADGIGKITINRPEVRNAFRPETLTELIDAFTACREDPEIGVVILTGAGDQAFCSGGDQRVRGHGGYVGRDGVPRLNALDLQKVIKYLPKPVIAMVAGYAIGGGHVLHLLCDLTIAADNARFGQTGPRVGSFDAGWGATYMARVVGHKKADADALHPIGHGRDHVLIEHHRRPAIAGLVDGATQDATVGRDRPVGLAEMLPRAILDRTHGFAGPLVVDVDVVAHAGERLVLLLLRIEAVVVALVLARHIVR